MPLNNYAFGKSIRYFRKKRGLSQSYLSELIDKSPSYISYVESGLRCIEQTCFHTGELNVRGKQIHTLLVPDNRTLRKRLIINDRLHKGRQRYIQLVGVLYAEAHG